MRTALEREESKEYKQSRRSAAQKDRSIIPNPELSQHVLITTAYRVTGILIPTTHLGD